VLAIFTNFRMEQRVSCNFQMRSSWIGHCRQAEIQRIVDEAARAGQRLAEARVQAADLAHSSSQLKDQLAAHSAENVRAADPHLSGSAPILPASAAAVPSEIQSAQPPLESPALLSHPLSATAAAAVTSEQHTGHPTPQQSHSQDHTKATGTAALPALKTWLAGWSRSLEGQLAVVGRLVKDDQPAAAVEVLNWVLETYTDVTRFPRPQRPDAAVLVAATEDAYVSRESVLELQRHLPGSEVRWVPGGHVSSFVLHHGEFRRAIEDSLNRL
jgi:pimeloyl-ACP methyl ester carboxylesterase